MYRIETEHLVIAESRWDDLEDFYRWERMDEVTEFFSIRDNQTMEDVVRKFVADDSDSKAVQFTLWLKGEKPRRIGRIVLADIEEGWALAHIYRRAFYAGQGIRQGGHEGDNGFLLR